MFAWFTRRNHRQVLAIATIFAGVLAGGRPAAAIIIMGTGLNANGTPATGANIGRNLTPAPLVDQFIGNTGFYNTTNPTPALTNSQYVGTVVSPTHFLTATHVSGGVNGFSVGGLLYKVQLVGSQDDLALFEIVPDNDVSTPSTFTNIAPIYTEGMEAENELDMRVVGRGTERGAAVELDGVNHGWRWGPISRARSWGDNQVAGYTTSTQPGFGGSLLFYTFDAAGPNAVGDSAGANEGISSDKDSGGPIFVLDDGVYKLAAVTSLVQAGPISYTSNQASTPNGSEEFLAAMFDVGGFYYGGDGNPNTFAGRQFIANTTADIPLAGIGTRLSTRTALLSAIPEPAGLSLLCVTALLMRRRR